MTTSTKPRGKRDQLYSFDDFIVKMHRSPAGIAWRWRTELTILTALAAALIALSFLSPLSGTAARLAFWFHITQCYPWVSLLIWGTAELAIITGTLLGIPQTRRFIIRRFWCVLARHRFQRLCWEARLHTRAGRLPVVLWVRPTKVGERLLVCCRAGISAEDFEKHTGELRAACYARDARVTRNMRWSQLVTIDIIRRDTLAANHAVSTPLARLTAIYADQLAALREPLTIPGPALEDDSPAWPEGPGLDPAA